MKLSAPYITRKLIALMLAMIIGLLTLNNALFMHLHRLSDGTLVVHAHPFGSNTSTDSPAPLHKHTKVELQFLDALMLLYGKAEVISVELFTPPTPCGLPEYYNQKGCNCPLNISNKAPPLFI